MGKSYIQLYIRNEKSIKILMVISLLMVVIGLYGQIFNYLRLNMPLFELNIWHNWFLVLHGIAMIIILNNSLKARRFFISWDNDEISYHFPKSKQPERIRIDEIESIQTNDSEIKFLLKNNQTKTINLNLVFLPKRIYIQEYFELLSIRIG